MEHHRSRGSLGLRAFLVSLVALAAAGISTDGATADVATTVVADSRDVSMLIEKVKEAGRINVIVGLNVAEDETNAGAPAAEASLIDRRDAIASARSALLADLRGLAATVYRTWDELPLVALSVDEAALRRIAASPLVRSVQEDALSGTLNRRE